VESSEITYFVTYPCPGCGTELEARHGGWQGWLRCPVCGVPALPPEFLFGHPQTRRRVEGPHEDDDILVIDAATATPRVLAPTPLSGSSPVSALRLIFLTGLILSLFLLLVFYMEQNKQTTAIFGFLSLIFFFLLLRTPSRRRRSVREE
jgi:hypothetical protein